MATSSAATISSPLRPPGFSGICARPSRELGLPSRACSTSSYQNKLLLAVETHVIDDQLDYNKPTAMSLARMHHCLHNDRQYLLFSSTDRRCSSAFLAAYVVYLSVCGQVRHWWLAPTTHRRCPSLVGAIRDSESSALRCSAEELRHVPRRAPAGRSARRSSASARPAISRASAKRAARTAEKLQRDQVRHQSRPDASSQLESTTATLLATAQVLSEDLGAWQSVYGRKQLNLPA